MNINKANLRIAKGLEYGNNPSKIILHHPEFNGSIEQLNEVMINDGFSMIGYNYYVRKDGTVWQGRPVEAIGANCYGQNSCSIGVCFEGNFMNESMEDIQYRSGVQLLKYLCSTYGIREIGGHKKYYNTDCPGTYFPLEMINEVLNESVSSASSTSSNVLMFQKFANREGIEDYEGLALNEDGIMGSRTKYCIGKLPMLSNGSHGAAVSFLQEALNNLGYSLVVDGIFGEATNGDVVDFQKSNELVMDGIVGGNTWNCLIR